VSNSRQEEGGKCAWEGSATQAVNHVLACLHRDWGSVALGFAVMGNPCKQPRNGGVGGKNGPGLKGWGGGGTNNSQPVGTGVWKVNWHQKTNLWEWNKG